MHAAAAEFRQAGIDERARLVDAAADPRDDLGADVHQVRVVAELHVGHFELAAALDVNLLGPVDHDVGHVRVVEQLFERTEAEQLVD